MKESMGEKRTVPQMTVHIIKADDSYEEREVNKAGTGTQLDEEGEYSAGMFMTPKQEMRGLKILVKNSNILPQCIAAYRTNIAGFGLEPEYVSDDEETPEMEAEWERLEEVLELLTIEKDIKELFEDIITSRETYGIGYMEVIRNLAGEVVQVDFVKDTPTVKKTDQLLPYQPYTYYHHGQELVRMRKFCKYRQEAGGQTVYYKEFGDPRIMDRRDGEYLSDGETLDRQYQANEILEFKIGAETYGEVRWTGQVLGVDGSYKAENLNNNYFRNGRHTPLMLIIKGGMLKRESYRKLQEYMNEVRGERGQHAFLLLEAENEEGRTGFEESKQVSVEVKELAGILQKDELFGDYLDANRKRVQSAFRLPDLYVGYTTDFNRATAQMAQEVTEEQVFQPERRSLEFIINKRLLNCYRFQYVEARFKEPDISNPDDLYKILTVTKAAGGLPPNKAKQIAYKAIGETAEDYEGDWANVPLEVSAREAQMAQISAQREQADNFTSEALKSLQGQIAKAQRDNAGDEVVTVMKEVRRLLVKMQEERE